MYFFLSKLSTMYTHMILQLMYCINKKYMLKNEKQFTKIELKVGMRLPKSTDTRGVARWLTGEMRVELGTSGGDGCRENEKPKEMEDVLKNEEVKNVGEEVENVGEKEGGDDEGKRVFKHWVKNHQLYKSSDTFVISFWVVCS